LMAPLLYDALRIVAGAVVIAACAHFWLWR
jgi:hypothetical protein